MTEEKEQTLIEEGKIKSLRYMGVFPETYTKLVNYLQSRPFKEVAPLLNEMAASEKQIEVNG